MKENSVKRKRKTNQGRAVIKLDKDGNVLALFNNLAEASKFNQISHSGINQCCLNIQGTSGGFKWKYV